MGGYSEAILPNIGLGVMLITENQMKKLGYFHLTINPNTKLNEIKKIMRYIIVKITCVHLEVELI